MGRLVTSNSKRSRSVRRFRSEPVPFFSQPRSAVARLLPPVVWQIMEVESCALSFAGPQRSIRVTSNLGGRDLTTDTPDPRSARRQGEVPIRKAPAVPGQKSPPANQEVPISPPGAPQVPGASPGTGRERPVRPAPKVPMGGQEQPVQPAPKAAGPTPATEPSAQQIPSPRAPAKPSARPGSGSYPIQPAPAPPAPSTGQPSDAPMTAPRVPMQSAPHPAQPSASRSTGSVEGQASAGAPQPIPSPAGVPSAAPRYPDGMSTSGPGGLPMQPVPQGYPNGQNQQQHSLPTATPVWVQAQPAATPPPMAPPSLLGGAAPDRSSASAWPIRPQPTPASQYSATGDAPIRATSSRVHRRTRRKDSSYLAMMFLMGATFFLLSVVMIIAVVLFL